MLFRGGGMRRSDRQIEREAALEILEKGEYGVAALIDPDGRPYSIPLNYCVHQDRVYFHCADEGVKIDCLLANPEASFCVIGDTTVLPDSFGSLYESCIIRGVSAEAFGDEKQEALESLIRKYSGEFWESGMKYIDKLTARTRVFSISIDEIAGKARRK